MLGPVFAITWAFWICFVVFPRLAETLLGVWVLPAVNREVQLSRPR